MKLGALRFEDTSRPPRNANAVTLEDSAAKPDKVDSLDSTVVQPVSVGQLIVATQIADNLEFPEQIYGVIRDIDFTLLKTLPNSEAELPINYSHAKPSQVDAAEILLTFSNNGALGIRNRESFTYEEMIDILDKMNKIEGKVVAPNDLAESAWRLVKFRTTMTPEQKQQFDAVLATRVDLSQYRTDVEHFYDKKPSLQKITVRGQEYSLEEFQKQAEGLFNISLEFDLKTTHLYRAVREHEWEAIQKEQSYLIRNRDNFEIDIGPQVSMYAGKEGYHGAIIRIPIKGPYFMPAGLQVARIACVYPHFIRGDEIEVSMDRGKTFVPLVT